MKLREIGWVGWNHEYVIQHKNLGPCWCERVGGGSWGCVLLVGWFVCCVCMCVVGSGSDAFLKLFPAKVSYFGNFVRFLQKWLRCRKRVRFQISANFLNLILFYVGISIFLQSQFFRNLSCFDWDSQNSCNKNLSRFNYYSHSFWIITKPPTNQLNTQKNAQWAS